MIEKLNDLFFYNLEKTTKIYRRYFQNQLKLNGFDITLDQWLTLKAVTEHPSIPQNEIADLVFKDKASVTRIIELLVQNEYLKRDFHATNRRLVQLTITEKGTQTIDDLDALVKQFRGNALADITLEDLNYVQGILKKIMDNCSTAT